MKLSEEFIYFIWMILSNCINIVKDMLVLTDQWSWLEEQMDITA